MSFLNISFLYFMLPLLIILIYFIMNDKSRLSNFFNIEILKKITIKGDKLGSKKRLFLLFLSFVFVIIALARPVVLKDEIKQDEFRKQAIILLDLSLSMLAKDVFPNRLEFAKNNMIKLIKELSDTDFAVILFTKNAFLLSPLTYDTQNLANLISNININFTTNFGTNIENALEKATELETGAKDIIIFTDGGDIEDVKNLEKIAKKENLTIHSVIIGTEKGSAIEYQNELIKDKNKNIVITKRNDTLSLLSKNTNGVFINEPQEGNLGIQRLKEAFLSAKQTKTNINIYDKKELFYYPLAVALILQFIAFNSLPKFIFLLLILIIPFEIKASMFDFRYLDKANKEAKNKNYEKAAKEYLKIDKNEAKFNAGNMYYKAKKYDEALKIYKTLQDKNLSYENQILHNIANAEVMKKEYEKAIKSYESSLKIKEDNETRENLEYTKELLKKQQNQNKKNQNKNSKNEEKNKQKDEQKQKGQANKKEQKEKKEESLKNKSQAKKEVQMKKIQNELNKRSQTTMPIPLNKNKKKDEEYEANW